MTTAANNPKIITLEDLEEKLESFIYKFNDDLCRTIIEYMLQKDHLQLLDIRSLDHHGFIRQLEIFLINSGES